MLPEKSIVIQDERWLNCPCSSYIPLYHHNIQYPHNIFSSMVGFNYTPTYRLLELVDPFHHCFPRKLRKFGWFRGPLWEIIPSGNLTVCYWKRPIEIVDVPIKNGWIFHSYDVAVYQRVSFGLTPISTEWSGPPTCSARKEALQRGDQPGAKAVIMETSRLMGILYVFL